MNVELGGQISDAGCRRVGVVERFTRPVDPRRRMPVDLALGVRHLSAVLRRG